MRPIRLEMAGFTSFREPTVVEFDDADYFALVGPTGSGKSTVIDALCFALYGSVPRYENRNLVAPVITQGMLEAKVRLDFSVSGRAYTAVRIVRRSGKGATTKEARLESDGEILAGNADELSERVAELIGLSFEHFTKCVVLPQGEFARFLHDKPADRQDMLVKLLNLDIYGRMMTAANTRAAKAKAGVALIETRLAEDFAGATTQAVAETKARCKQLGTLRERVGEASPKLAELGKAIEVAHSEAGVAQGWIEVLGAIKVPREMSALSDELAHATKNVTEAQALIEQAETAVGERSKALAAMPDKDPLIRFADGHKRRRVLAERIATAEKAVKAAVVADERAGTRYIKAIATLEAAVAAETKLRDAHQAQHLAGGLVAGKPCPVCLQKVSKLPKHPQARGLKTAENATTKARDALAAVEKSAGDMRSARTEREAGLKALSGQAADIDKELKGHPDAAAVEQTLSEIAAAHAALETARAAEGRARRDLSAAASALAAVKDKEDGHRRRFEELRDALVPLRPPAAERRDLGDDWDALVRWAADQVPALEKKRATAAGKVDAAQTKYQALVDELAAACIECDLEIDGGDISEIVVTALADARTEAAAVAKAIADLKKLEVDLAHRRRDHELAAQLAQHLSATGFEKWIVNEALRRLVLGATEILKELSGGQYSLVVDDNGTFGVIDHYNADETRSARTLSGGETFLASLALALALSDQLIELAAEGSARLDAIFLDEGFGTLDPETLEIVAATVDNLAARGRMVGIVTHVRELADRIPVQFRVAKDPRTSTVEKVLA